MEFGGQQVVHTLEPPMALRAGTLQEGLQDNPILLIFRALIYILFLLKLFEMCLNRRRKLRIHERIQRKFLIAHGPDLVRSFSSEESTLMELTLRNTLKNATEVLHPSTQQKHQKHSKRVNFVHEANVYYDPPSLPLEHQGSTSQISSPFLSDSDIQKISGTAPEAASQLAETEEESLLGEFPIE